MSFLLNCIKGIAIGSGAILPGISSGVLCVVFGIYENLLNSVLHFFSDIKKNIKFLFPILVGVGIGVLIFSNLLNYLLANFPLQTKSIFIGLILGSIPSLLKEINSKCKFKTHYLLFTFSAFFIGCISVILEKNMTITNISNYSTLYLTLSGFLMSVGVIVPGVSSTIILMLLGIYTTYISSVSSLYFPVLIPLGIGLVFGSIVCMILTKFLFEHFYAQTFYTIIGFTLGSILILLPSITFDFSLVICLLCILCGFLTANLLSNQ